MASGPIDVLVRALYQSGVRQFTVLASEAKRHFVRARGAHFIERAKVAGPANGGGSVQVAIFCLKRGSLWLGAGRAAEEVVHAGQLARRGDLKDRAIVAARPAIVSRTVKLPIAGERQSSNRLGAVHAQRITLGSAENVERGRLGRSSGKFENRALGATAHLCCSVELPILALNEIAVARIRAS